MPPPDPFEQAFWNLLCWFYQQLGRDCANLPKPPSMAAKALYQAYMDERPLSLNEQERAVFLSKLSELEAMLNNEQNPLNEDDTNMLLEFIALARQDLGA